jgi:hypothetical protein
VNGRYANEIFSYGPNPPRPTRVRPARQRYPRPPGSPSSAPKGRLEAGVDRAVIRKDAGQVEIFGRRRSGSEKTPRRGAFVEKPDAATGPEGPHKFAAILSDEAKQLLRMNRYERRALSRRKFAVRAFDAARSRRRSSSPRTPPSAT